MTIDPDLIANQVLGKESPKTAFKTWSPRLKRWTVFGSLGFAFLGLVLLLHSSRSNRSNPNSKDDLAARQTIPDHEISSDYLASLGGSEKKLIEKQKNEEKPASHIPQNVPLPPVGSMVIFTSDGSGETRGELGIPMGTELEAVIEKTVIANNRGIPVVAKLTSDHIQEGRLLIPKGSQLFGQTEGLIEDRLQVRFTRLVFPNGKDAPFSGVADAEGHLKDKKMGRAMSILSGAAIGSTGVFMPGGSSYGDTFLRGTHQGAIQDAGKDWNHYRNTQATPVLTIRAKKRIKIMVDRPL